MKWTRRPAALCVVGLLGVGLSACGDSGKQTAPPTAATTKPKVVTKRVFYINVTGALTSPVQLPGTAVLAGRLILVGGLDQADASLTSITAASEAGSNPLGTLPTAIHDVGAATVGDSVFAFGGGNAGSTSQSILKISANGSTAEAGRLPTGESDTSAATVAGTAYVVGGYDGTNGLSSIVAFKPGSQAKVVAHLPNPLRYAAVAAVGNRVMIAGGTNGTTPMPEVYAFDPASRKLTHVADLPHPVTHASGASLEGRFLIIGGRGADSNSQVSSVYEVDPETAGVKRVAHLPMALSDMGSGTIGNHILAVGGKDSSGIVHTGIFKLGWRIERITATPTTPGLAAKGVPHAGHVPALLNPHNIYAAGAVGNLSPSTHGAKALVYVPNSESNTLDVISQKSFKVIDHFQTGRLPQHVVPSWDLKTLWITNDYGNSLTPIDPNTGKPGKDVPVDDPYNMYFKADGTRAIVVAEALRRLDFRDPHTMQLKHSLPVPDCRGVDHMDYTRDGNTALVSCEFAGRMIVVDLKRERVIKTVELRTGAMPQDVKISPDGKVFYIADMASNGIWLVDAAQMKKIGFVPTGTGAHGLYPSRDAKRLFVSNRGEGSVSVVSFSTRKPITKWRIPGGGSPDMGGVSADGKVLWLSGRYSSAVYAISTSDGRLLARIPVGNGPHGMAVWPQPGRYSIGHTGILR